MRHGTMCAYCGSRHEVRIGAERMVLTRKRICRRIPCKEPSRKRIEEALCAECGLCADLCPSKAIMKEERA